MRRTDLVLVTGGAGFIGKHVAAEIRRQGGQARALDLLNPQVHRSVDRSVAEFAGEVRHGDVRDPDAVLEAIDECTSVVHLAAETGVGQSMYEDERYTSVNVTGTLRVLEAAEKRGIPVLIASSRAVYGGGAYRCSSHGRTFGTVCCADARPDPSRESDPAAPVSIYGETKVRAEQLGASYAAQGLPVAIIRPQNVIGAGQALHNPYTGVLAAFAARLREGRPPQVYGTGEQTRDFIGVDDVAIAITWLLEHSDSWAEYPVLNIGSGRRVTLTELAVTACHAAGLECAPEFVDVSRPGDIDHACADLALARAAGLPEPRRELTASVRAFMDYAASDAPVDSAIWDRALEELAVKDRND